MEKSCHAQAITLPMNFPKSRQFGHGETKATCLWLKNLPKLKPTNVVPGRHGRVWREPPSPDRWKNRSRTYQGIANAMSEQWGGELSPASKPSWEAQPFQSQGC